MKYIKSIIHWLSQNKQKDTSSSIGNVQRQSGTSDDLTYGILFMIFLVFAIWSYHGSNTRLVGPPFGDIIGQDFRQILRASAEIVRGEKIYQHAIPFANSPNFAEFMWWGAAPYPYSPVVAVLAIPLLRFQENSVLIFWTFISWLLLVATGIIIVIGILGDRHLAKVLVVLIFFGMYGPVQLNLKFVQLDICILFLISLTFFLYKRDSLYAGIVLGLAISLKLLVIPMVAYFLWKKDWKTVALSLLTAFLLTIVGFSVAGWSQLTDFIKVNYLWSVTDMLSYPFNQSINGFGIRLFTSNAYIEPLINLPTLAFILRFAGSAGAILLWLAVVGRTDNRHSPIGFLEYGFTLSTMLFLSPLVDDIHYVWALLPISGLLVFMTVNGSDRKKSLLSIVTLFCVLFLAHPDLHDAVYYGWENLVYNNSLVSQKFVLLTGAYVYGLLGLETCLLANILYLRQKTT